MTLLEVRLKRLFAISDIESVECGAIAAGSRAVSKTGSGQNTSSNQQRLFCIFL
jgi:hypothetical protein